MDTSADISSVPIGETVAPYNSIPSHQVSTTSNKEFGMITSGDDGIEKAEAGHSRGNDNLSEASQQAGYDVFEANYTETEGPERVLERVEDDYLLKFTGGISGLSAMAPEFFPVCHEITNTDETQDRSRNHQSGNIFLDKNQENSNSPITISQISEVAAEVADTAALLDVTPPEPATPELLSTLDGISGVNIGSPVVELVLEQLALLPEASTVVPEAVDTATMLDRFGPTGERFITGPGGYAMEQTLEEVHIGAIRIVQITEPDFNLASIEEDSKQESNKHIGIVKPTTHPTLIPSGYQPIPAFLKGKIHLANDISALAPLPHLRTKAESIFSHEISDSELSNTSSMSDLSMNRLDINISFKRFADSIFIEDLVILASDLYATGRNIPTNAIKCIVDPNPRFGSKNLFYSIDFSDKYSTQTHRWVVRIPFSIDGFSCVEQSWLKSDIRAMEFIKERTDIPIPFIYGYDFSTQNRIGAPYVLMDFMEGDRVEDVWESWDNEKKTRCLLQCAESMRKLGSFGFNKIGVLGCDYSKEEYTVHGIPFDTKGKEPPLKGPYPSTKAYLDDIWRTQMIELRSSTKPESVKARQLLILLKLLVPALVDFESTTQQFFLSLPEFGGKNVLVDCNGSVTAFVGWEKVMIMPKGIGYARYPEWITKDWVSAYDGSPTTSVARKYPKTQGVARHKAVLEIGRKSLASKNITKGVIDDKDIISGYSLEENEDAPKKIILNLHNLAPSSPSICPNNIQFTEKQSSASQAISNPENSATDSPEATLQKLVSIPVSASQSSGDSAPAESSGGKKKQRLKGMGSKNSKGRPRVDRGNRPQPRQRQNYDYNESVELQKAITDEDKTKAHALSQWNSLPEKISKDEAEERDERKKAWMAKEETEKVAAINRARKLPPMVEIFKKVVVEKDLERKLLKVIKTERKGRDNEFTDIKTTVSPQPLKPSDMVQYRKIYHEHFTKISPRDELSSKLSHISTAFYTAFINDKLRPSIVPKLAKYVIGEAVGPSILGMVGNGEWAKQLLMGLDEGNYILKEGISLFNEDPNAEVVKGKGGYRNVWKLLILGPTLVTSVTLIILSTSILLAWALGFAEYQFHSIRSANEYTALANIRLNLQIPALFQYPIKEAAKHTRSYFLDKVNFVLDYSPSLVTALILLMVVLPGEDRTEPLQHRYH